MNANVASFLASSAAQTDKDALIKFVTSSKIRDTGSYTYSEKKELNREFNLGELSPDDAARRSAVLGKTYSVLGKVAPPDLSKRNAFAADDDYYRLEAFFKPQSNTAASGKENLAALLKQNANPQDGLEHALDDSARALERAVIAAAMASSDRDARLAGAAFVAPPAFDPNAKFARRLSAATTDEHARDGMKRFGELLQARALGQDLRWKSYVDSDDIARRLQGVLQDKALVAELTNIRNDTNAETKAEWGYRGYVAYLHSAAFEKFVALQPEADKKRVIAEALSKVAIIDGQAARDVLDHLQDRAAATMIDGLSDAELGSRLAKLDTGLGGNPAQLESALGSDARARAAKLDAFRRIVRARADRSVLPLDAVAALNSSGFAQTAIGAGADWLTGGASHGSAAALALSLGVAGDSDGVQGKHEPEGIERKHLLTLLRSTDVYEATGKLLAYRAGREIAAHEAVGMMAKLAVLKKLGPAFDLVGGVVHTGQGLMSLHEGDSHKAVWQFADATGEFTVAAGTIMLLAGASGPAAPIVILVGTTIVIVAKVGELQNAKEPEVEFLRKARLLAKVPKPVSDDRSLAESFASHERDVRNARSAIGDANYVLDRPIGADPRRLEQAREVKYRAQAVIASAQDAMDRIAKRRAVLAEEMRKLQITPSDWDGFWPEDIRAREERERTIHDVAGNTQRMHSLGAPIGR